MKLIIASVVGLAAICSFTPANAQMRESRTVIVHKEGHRGPAARKVIIRHDNGLHRGWAHSRHRGATVVKKKVITYR